MKYWSTLLLLLVTLPAEAQDRRAPDPRSMGGGDCRDNVYNCADTPNPLPAPDTVWIEEMTWMDVRDALADGKTTAIVPTGGIEPNGPWLVTGKHNYVLKANCDAIARRLGDALCAPVIKLVPEGQIEPQTGHMRSPGTLSVRQDTFEAMLTDVARSLKTHGFRNIVFIGDSGGNQQGQRAVAERLNAEWNSGPIVAHVPEYYDYDSVRRYMAYRGLETGESDGLHDDPLITLNMFYADPSSIRYDERVARDLASIDGVSLADRIRTLELARKVVAFRAAHTAEAIHRALANRGTLPAPPRQTRPARASNSTPSPAPDPRSLGGGSCKANDYNCAGTPNPLPTADTVWLEAMTWIDVRDALASGTTTAIISTGGVEPNGPWLATGKHNFVLRANCERIARRLGDALCAPVIELVPEGQTDPPTGHMRSPGTLSLQQGTFEALLTDVAHSLKMHGFTNIVLIGDSGGNQSGMANVATALSERWEGEVRVVHVPEYYRAPDARDVLGELGVTTDAQPSDGLHDNPTITLNMMLDDPESVRWSARVTARQATIDGVSIANLARSLELAEQIASVRAQRTVARIRERLGQ
ncbi:MAG: hypothetical protein CL483_11205 [Acidobacteria bacterium]|nr:hypothetical protein [Acidobacteriota bacterium]